MPIQVTCGSCGQRLKAPDGAAGKATKCPSCGSRVAIPGGGALAGEAVESVLPRGSAPWGGGRRANPLGITAVVLGALALLIGWIPLLGLLALPLAGLAVTLGLIGLVLASRDGSMGKGAAVTGMSLGGVAAAVALVVTLWVARVGQDSLVKLQQEMDKAAVAGSGDRGLAAAPDPATATAAPAPAPDGTFAGQDRNGDGRLSADELPEALKARFAAVDADGDGYVDRAEWDRAEAATAAEPVRRGKRVAQRVFTAADDFVVDVWHNGKRVPDEARQMVGENYGATSEKIEVEVREGDWLVFNVANNRLRWNGSAYFGAAGVNDDEPKVAFVSDPDDPHWSYCDDPGQVPAFIAHPGYLARHAAKAPENPWGGGDNEMRARVPEWQGKPVWGERRTVWIKYVAPAPSGPSGGSSSSAEPKAAMNKDGDDAPAPSPEKGADAGGSDAPTPAPAAPAVTLKTRATLTGHPAMVYCVAVTPDGAKVVSGSAPKYDIGVSDETTVIVWDVADGGKTRVPIKVKNSVTGLALTPDGRSVAVPDGNNVSLFDLKTGRRTLTLPGPPRTNVNTVAVSPDGTLVAGGLFTKEVVVCNVATKKPVHTLTGHTGPVFTLAFSPDGAQLASGGDETARLWNVAKGEAEHTLKGEGATSPLTCVAYTPDGASVATINGGDQPQFWDPKTGRHQRSIGGNELLSFQSVAFSRDGKRLATASMEPVGMKNVVVLWDAATGRRLATGVDPDGMVRSAAFTPDGKTLATTGGNTVKLWDILPAE